MSKCIAEVENSNFVLEVYACDCGYHIGLDFTYSDQVGDVTVPCPACERPIKTDNPH